MAFREAVEEVIDEHARLGLPLYIWRDGKVVGLSAQEVRVLAQPESRFGPWSEVFTNFKTTTCWGLVSQADTHLDLL
jgi:hypothetical protein